MKIIKISKIQWSNFMLSFDHTCFLWLKPSSGDVRFINNSKCIHSHDPFPKVKWF